MVDGRLEYAAVLRVSLSVGREGIAIAEESFEHSTSTSELTEIDESRDDRLILETDVVTSQCPSHVVWIPVVLIRQHAPHQGVIKSIRCYLRGSDSRGKN